MARKKIKSRASEQFFVNLKDPIDLRREILESSKSVIEGLQRFEQFKRIREEKGDTEIGEMRR